MERKWKIMNIKQEYYYDLEWLDHKKMIPNTNLRNVTAVTFLRFKFGSIKTDIYFCYNSYIYFILCKSPDTQGRKATSRCGLQLFYYRGRCHLLLGLKQGYPLLQSIRMQAWVSSIRIFVDCFISNQNVFQTMFNVRFCIIHQSNQCKAVHRFEMYAKTTSPSLPK